MPVNSSTVAVILGGSAGLVGMLKTIPKYWAAAPSGMRFPALGNWDVDPRRARRALGDRRRLDVVLLEVVGDRVVGTRAAEGTSGVA